MFFPVTTWNGAISSCLTLFITDVAVVVPAASAKFSIALAPALVAAADSLAAFLALSSSSLKPYATAPRAAKAAITSPIFPGNMLMAVAAAPSGSIAF